MSPPITRAYRLAALRAFFTSGQHVCPFAKSPEHIYVGMLPHCEPRELRPWIEKFVKAKPGVVLVIAADLDPLGIPHLRAWANHLFTELAVITTVVSNPDISRDDIVDQVHDAVVPKLAEDSQERAYLNIDLRPLITICLSPLYPTTHPRYAPVTCLVLTWTDDIARKSSKQIITPIRAVMLREQGEIYDANELVLPLPAATP